MREGTSLKKQFHLGEVDSSELVHTFSSVFNMASQHEEEVAYNRSDDPVALVAIYSNGDLIDVVTGPGLKDDDLARITGEADELLQPGRIRIARHILFAALPVEDCLDVRPHLQILPPPANAPKPRQSHAKHPFVLEFPFMGSKNVWITSSRQMSEVRKWKLLLNLLLEWGVSDVGTSHDWMFVPEYAEGKLTLGVEYLQTGYYVEEFVALSDDFTDSAAIPRMLEMEDREYRDQLGIRGDRTLCTAPFVAALIRRFPELSLSVQERFLRAAFWYKQASRPQVSVSAEFIGLVSAIETLIDQDKGAPNCDKCGKTLGRSATQRFIDFVNAQFPANYGGDSALAKLYRVRSALAHGWSLFRLDEDPMFTLHPTTSQEYTDRMMARHLTRAVLLSWLASRSSPSE